MVTDMLNERDPDLNLIFAQARESLAGEQFTVNLLLKIEGARRARMWRQIVAVAAVVILLALNLRPLLATTTSAMLWVGDLLPAYSEFLITPWGWAVSALIGGWVLRSRLLHR